MPIVGSTTGQIFNTESGRIEEILSKQIDTILPTLDPIWRDTVVTSQGVGPVSEFSRDFVVNKLYRTGMTGVIEQMNPVEDFGLYGDSQNSTIISDRLLKSNAGTMKTFPDPADGPKAKTFSLSVPMRAMYTNLMLTLGELQMEATPAVIGDVIAPTLQGFAQNLSHTLCNYWYVSQNENYRLGTNASGTVAAATGAAALGATAAWTFSITEESYERFFPGQRIDVYNSSDQRKNQTHPSNANTYVPTYVHSVDDLSGTITIVAGSDWGDLAADDYFVYANSGQTRASGGQSGATFTGIAGVNSWLKATGDLLGAEAGTNTIDVDEHPEFKSFVLGSVGVLTETKLRQYIRRFHAAKQKLGQSIDSFVASDGVWLSYEAQKIGQYMIDRTGNLSNLTNEGSNDGFAFTFEGRTYKGYTSNYVSDGQVYGWKTSGNNWKRYVPPDYAGLQKMGEVDQYVPFRFVVPALTGTSSVKYPYMNAGSNLLSEAVQMPGMLRMQLIPDQPAGLKLDGVTTDKAWGGSTNY